MMTKLTDEQLRGQIASHRESHDEYKMASELLALRLRVAQLEALSHPAESEDDDSELPTADDVKGILAPPRGTEESMAFIQQAIAEFRAQASALEQAPKAEARIVELERKLGIANSFHERAEIECDSLRARLDVAANALREARKHVADYSHASETQYAYALDAIDAALAEIDSSKSAQDVEEGK